MASGIKIAVVGAGAIGGWIAARLALGGHDVSLLVREGRAGDYGSSLTLVDKEQVETAAVRTSEQAGSLGRQDVVIFATKAFAMPSAAAAARPMIGDDTLVVPMMNGVPWWFDEQPLEAIDPEGRIGEAIALDRVVGCVVHAACLREETSRIRIQMVDHLVVGEPGGGSSARVSQLAQMFEKAGVPARSSPDIRAATWYKLWGNMTINPLSALTLATADRLVDRCRPFLLAAMEEARAIGEAIGCPIEESGDQRLDVTRRLGAFKTSMLQDVEAGRPIELDALLGAPLELARRHGVDAPNLSHLFAMTRLMAQSRGLLP